MTRDERKLRSLVARFSRVMLRELLEHSRNGQRGWDEEAERGYFGDELINHARAERWIGVANFSAFLWNLDNLADELSKR